ncbi:hypothetical protein B0F90DRAFT_839633 [Multifurca ochricompacta]|uniref:Uncharacterized protein n=1 Tax=Multifurca ochricompacta TaxID=376703 RepID=A0AAD4QJI1_9AGAM|nr:hypothetical protein B0F90DRAFT_839633 [Multifurca ochricompacta]
MLTEAWARETQKHHSTRVVSDSRQANVRSQVTFGIIPETCPSSPPASEISSIITPNAPSVASPSTRSAASRSHRHHHQHSGPHRQQLTTTLAVSPPLNMSHPMAELPRSGQEGGGLDNPMNQSTASVHEPWIPAAGARDGRPVTLSHQRPAPVVDYNMAPPSRSQPVEQQQRHNLALKTYSSHRPQAQQEGVRPPPPTASSHAAQKCIIPDCPYKAYYNYAEQEQTEYCGQGHELHAIDTGLVKPCVICKGRPRRTGERVCGRVCRERERERSHPRPRSHPHPHPHPHPSHQLGSYHGAPEA